MSALEVRQVKRPRLSFSCRICLARKVRCGREQPECSNCLRMNRQCTYETLIRDEMTGRLRQPSPSPRVNNSTRLDFQNTPTWSQANSLIGFGNIRPTQGNSNQVNDLSTVVNSDSNSRESLPRQNQPLDKVHPSAPIQGPIHHDVSSSGATSTAPSDQRISPQDHRPDKVCLGYLSLRQGGRVRYIGKAFWGFIPGQESLSDDFFDQNRNAQPGLPLPHIAAADLANLLKSLPPKPVCDIFLHDFFIAIWPLNPLVHPATLQADYDEFWTWCRNNDTAMPPAKFLDSPTFICLLFAVLFCGASVTPASMGTTTSLENQKMGRIANHLKAAYRASLSDCRHLEHPTFNTLVSTLITRPFIDLPSEPMQNLLSLSTTVRIAQTMGLHSESDWSALDPITRELRRRVWWHIVWLDVQSSISTGLPLCCGEVKQAEVCLINSSLHDKIGNCNGIASPPAEFLKSGGSAAVMYAVGLYETARLESKIVTSSQSERDLFDEGLGLVTAIKQLHQKLDILIAKIPIQGFPELGIIPSRWIKASAMTHPSLYKDDTTQPTVFAAWVRIMLTLLKFEVVILIQKPILQTLKHERPHELRTWTSMVLLCTSYLEIYLRLYRTPSFAPYVWFYRISFGPLQSTYILLIYLLRFRRHPPDDLSVRLCVDRAIETFMTEYQSADTDSPLTDANPDKSESHMPVTIQTLVDLRRRLDSPAGCDEPTPSSVDIRDWRAASKGGIHGDVPSSGPDQKFIAGLYDLQNWTTQLLQDSKGFRL